MNVENMRRARCSVDLIGVISDVQRKRAFNRNHGRGNDVAIGDGVVPYTLLITVIGGMTARCAI
jgi:hypothetical protein